MNIIFGALVLLFAAGTVAMWVVGPVLQKRVVGTIAARQAEEKAAREAKLAELKKSEDAAKSQEEKDAIKSEREALEKQVEPDLSSMDDVWNYNQFADRRVAAYSISELSASIILNVLMIVSGAGLMAMAEWARRLAIAVSWLKILRWIAMTVVVFVLILPISLDLTQKTFAKMDAQMKVQSGGRAAPLPFAVLAPATAVFGGVTAVFSAIVSSVYPALSIWFLTRPAARAACLKASLAKTAESGAGVDPSW
jgi:hypothetical protein